jgi:Bacterial Ig-like domain
MAGPNIVSVSPNPNAVGVVLGQAISIVFDSLIDHTTLSAASISVSYPSGSDLVTPDSYIAQVPQTQTGTALVQGTYTATDSETATTLNFQPSQPFQTNTLYTVFVLGADAQFSTAMVKDTSGNPLAVSYQVSRSGRSQKPHARAPAAVPVWKQRAGRQDGRIDGQKGWRETGSRWAERELIFQIYH